MNLLFGHRTWQIPVLHPKIAVAWSDDSRRIQLFYQLDHLPERYFKTAFDVQFSVLRKIIFHIL